MIPKVITTTHCLQCNEEMEYGVITNVPLGDDEVHFDEEWDKAFDYYLKNKPNMTPLGMVAGTEIFAKLGDDKKKHDELLMLLNKINY